MQAPIPGADSNDAWAVEALARRIQTLPTDVRWAFSQQDVIQATAKSEPVMPGARTAQIAAFLGFAASFGLDVAAAKLLSLLFLGAVYWRQLRVRTVGARANFFVGICALRERELVPQFEAIQGGPAIVVDQRLPAALTAIYRPGAAELWRSWHDAAQPVFAYLKSDRSPGLFDRSYVLSFLVRRLHHYAHFLAVFRGLNASNPGAVVAFSTADLPAYAAVQAGIETIYFQHGFWARSLVFPDFHRIVAFNAPEAEHVQSRLSAASVSSSAPIIRPLQITRRVAVVGDYGEKLARSRELITFCRSRGIAVVVRPHPADRSDYWKQWSGVSGVCIDPAGTFDEFLDRHRPCVMATWYSTTIWDALMRGVVPVTFEADQPDIVFPFANVALHWPEQKQQIQAILANPSVRYETLARSLAYVISPMCVRSVMQRFEACNRDLENSVGALCRIQR